MHPWDLGKIYSQVTKQKGLLKKRENKMKINKKQLPTSRSLVLRWVLNILVRTCKTFELEILRIKFGCLKLKQVDHNNYQDQVGK